MLLLCKCVVCSRAGKVAVSQVTASSQISDHNTGLVMGLIGLRVHVFPCFSLGDDVCSRAGKVAVSRHCIVTDLRSLGLLVLLITDVMLNIGGAKDCFDWLGWG